MSARAKILAAVVALGAALALAYVLFVLPARYGTVVLLLVPDDQAMDDPKVTVWLDAASEEGLKIAAVRDSEFLRPWFPRTAYAGAILPDQVHARASDVLVRAIEDYVRSGGHLMLVYDAGAHTQAGTYARERSRFSDLAGVDYALYDALAARTIQWDAVIGQPEVFRRLLFPPGKYTATSAAGAVRPTAYAVAGYEHGTLRYPSFVTRGAYRGHTLLQAPDGTVVAGERALERGKVVFVNLPLGYLKLQTDGLLLHGFLRYFADTVLALPYLSPVPDGIGGLVVNWHLDSNVVFPVIGRLEELGLYRYGPYSIHVTAGPDARRPGDRLGIDVPRNQPFQDWLRKMGERHAIGSHGGWIHDWFAGNVGEQPGPAMVRYLELNKRALEDATGKPVLEYSAPKGHHPEWVTQWLEEQGVLAYYFTGNAGLGPTRSYRDGRLAHRRIWSFPILTLGDLASFEEMRADGLRAREVTEWLRAITDFCKDSRAARLVYFHPPGLLLYPESVRAWFRHIDRTLKDGDFRLYTMTDLARFLNQREQVQWVTTRAGGNGVRFDAEHPTDLSHQAWLLDRQAYERPVVTGGQGTVHESPRHWIVVAGQVRRLQFHADRTQR